MPIRVGLLSIPAVDDVAVGTVRHCLMEHIPGCFVAQEASAQSQRNWVADLLQRWCDEEELDVIITIGGTLPAPGPGNAECVPEATLAILDRLLPGLPEEMRAYAREQTPLALIDRSVAGIRGRSLILNLPNGAGPARLFLEAVVDLIQPIVAHLHEQPDAPRLATIIAPLSPQNDSSLTPAASSSEQGAGRRGLDAAEFAEFLQRKNT